MRTTNLVIPLALALALVTPASAGHCTTYSTSEAEFDTNPMGVPLAPRIYYEGTPGPVCDFYCPWIYEESNGIDGLQRGDEVQDDTCHGLIESDAIVF